MKSWRTSIVRGNCDRDLICFCTTVAPDLGRKMSIAQRAAHSIKTGGLTCCLQVVSLSPTF